MEPKAKQILYTPVDIDDADFVDIDREPSEDEIEFQKFKDEFKQSNEYAKVSVYRQPTTSDGRPGQKNLTFLFEAGVDEYTFSQLAGKLRDEYGTGTYRVQLRDKENLMKMNRAISIEAPKLSGDDNTPGNIIAIVSRALQEQQVRTENMFRQLSGPQTSGDAIDQIIKITTAIAPILTALGISRPEPAAPPKTLIEQITEHKMLMEFFGGSDDAALGGDANIYSLLTATMQSFGGPIAAAIAAGAESGALNPQGVVALEAPKPMEAEKVTDKEKTNMAMRENIHILIKNAKMKIPPEAFAKVLVSSTPEEKSDELWEFISAEKCIDAIIELEPAAAEYREWFEKLREAVIGLMSDDEPEQVVPEISGGIEPHYFQAMEGSQVCALCSFIEGYKYHLQAGEDAGNLRESEVVADVENGEPSTSASQSDSDTPSDT